MATEEFCRTVSILSLINHTELAKICLSIHISHSRQTTMAWSKEYSAHTSKHNASIHLKSRFLIGYLGVDWFKTQLNTARTLMFHKSTKFLHSPRNYKLTKVDPSFMGNRWEDKPTLKKERKINTKNLKHLEILFFCPEYFRTNQY